MITVQQSKRLQNTTVKSSDFLTDDDEKIEKIVNDLRKRFVPKAYLVSGGLLKQKHKIL
ncbi:hypothetical protein ABFE52_13495 [Staphylococcus ureilyticus]